MGDCELLRLLTCGSVDDGKSTLIGRLLYESGAVPDDQMAALERDSHQYGTTGGTPDFALLLDGLEAEREQNITIDVAYRYFSTSRRSFIVADAPGHEQYTRNMATGASTSDVAVILVDSRFGIRPQSRRHTAIASLFGIRHFVLAVNKLDLTEYSQSTFDEITNSFRDFASRFSLEHVVAIPVSALFGDNITTRSTNTDWYEGPSLTEYLETVDVRDSMRLGAARFPVQYVNRPNADFRGYAGTLVGGHLRKGDRIRIGRSGIETSIGRIVSFDGDLEAAEPQDAITLTLTDEVDIGRGDILTPVDRPISMADQFTANLLWMDSHPMLPGRAYDMRLATQWRQASVSLIRHRLNVVTLEHESTDKLALNELGLCHLTTALPVAADTFENCRETGSFILVDRETNRTCGAGMITAVLREAGNVPAEPSSVDRGLRARLNGQRPCTIWFTGLSGAGKSTIARLVEKRLAADGYRTYTLDGDNLRRGLNRDLGFSDADRVENIRRAGEVARILVDAGIITLCAFISPFRAERRAVRGLLAPGEFIEVYVDTPIEECERRDPKGLYAKARAGVLRNFTGITSDYEAPESPELVVRTMEAPPEQIAEAVVFYLRKNRYLERGAGAPPADRPEEPCGL